VRKCTLLCLVIVLLELTFGCGQRVPFNQLTFDAGFDSLFHSISNKDTIFFENDRKTIDTFILTKTDSLLQDRINCFNCPLSARSIYRYYKQYPINYWAEEVIEGQGTGSEKTVKREVPLISVSVTSEGVNTAYISFKKFHCTIDRTLGVKSTDTIQIGDYLYTDFYAFESSNPSQLVVDKDVKTLFVSLKYGILGYKEKSGTLRRRKFN
jgi:hypothetical protein